MKSKSITLLLMMVSPCWGADQAAMTLDGSVVADSCQLTAGGDGQRVALGELTLEQVRTGTLGDWKALSLNFEHCSGTVTFDITHQGSVDTDNPQLLAAQGSGKGVGIELQAQPADSGVYDPVTLNSLQNGWHLTGNKALNYRVRLHPNGAAASVGNVVGNLAIQITWR
ncbi:fimbrial protein BcfE [Serratia quinivorans]|uniref:fimbrial protein n=1 Tax=Serratia quinivorans TaxID=137545 RepID=UPI002179D6CB|nr:fimbrial protein [Serratia quinivorans]CAI1604498.1 fimbrial protein BcfE [Serratia quinivorans]